MYFDFYKNTSGIRDEGNLPFFCKSEQHEIQPTKHIIT